MVLTESSHAARFCEVLNFFSQCLMELARTRNIKWIYLSGAAVCYITGTTIDPNEWAQHTKATSAMPCCCCRLRCCINCMLQVKQSHLFCTYNICSMQGYEGGMVDLDPERGIRGLYVIKGALSSRAAGTFVATLHWPEQPSFFGSQCDSAG